MNVKKALFNSMQLVCKPRNGGPFFTYRKALRMRVWAISVAAHTLLLLAACMMPVPTQSADSPNLSLSSPIMVPLPPVKSTAQTFCVTVSSIANSECESLVIFYLMTNGTEWRNNTDWLLNSDPCTWYGITCMEGRIDKLNLSNNELHGSIPESISDLHKLRQLYLDNNNLSGSIPSVLGNLTELQVLLLSANQLNGPIPESLGDLRNLSVLYLDQNQLNGSIPASLGNLQSIRYLFLQSNNLTGTIPDTLGNLIQMRDLHLYENHLQGSIPLSLQNIPSLQHIKLQNNDASLCLPASLESWANSRNIYEPPPGGICP